MNLYDIDKQLENVTSRLITHEDMAFLRSLPDFDKIRKARPFDSYFADSGYSVIDISDTEKLFELGEVFPVTANDRYVYTNGTSVCVMIYLGDGICQIFFCSEDLRDKLEYIKLVYSCLLTCFGFSLKNRIYDHVYSAGYIMPRSFIEDDTLDY